MNLLVVIDGINGGGAEKSLISFATTLMNQKDSEVNLDLMIFKPEGLFMNQIPKGCNLLATPKELTCMSYAMTKMKFWKNSTPRGLIGKINRYMQRCRRDTNGLCDRQRMWEAWKSYIPAYKKHYDVAMSYLHGIPNYYVIDKVNADKKILYIHNEYERIVTDHQYDRRYFEKANKVVTISDRCVQSFLNVFPDLGDKICMIENISSSNLIHSLASQYEPREYGELEEGRLRLISIGRLTKQKRFDWAIKAAAILKERGMKFTWFILGQGELQEELMRQIGQAKVEDCVRLIGVRENPYPYIKYADIFVQTSSFEGKSVVIDEAKILGKPIVVTNYKTVFDTIEHEKNGWIVEMNPESIADGIWHLAEMPAVRMRLSDELEKKDYGNESEIVKYYEIWN